MIVKCYYFELKSNSCIQENNSEPNSVSDLKIMIPILSKNMFKHKFELASSF